MLAQDDERGSIPEREGVSDPHTMLHLPARDIPIPTSVSAEAQAVLAMPPMEKMEYPALDDLEGWRAMIASHEETVGRHTRRPGVECTGGDGGARLRRLRRLCDHADRAR